MPTGRHSACWFHAHQHHSVQNEKMNAEVHYLCIDCMASCQLPVTGVSWPTVQMCDKAVHWGTARQYMSLALHDSLQYSKWKTHVPLYRAANCLDGRPSYESAPFLTLPLHERKPVATATLAPALWQPPPSQLKG